VIGRLSSQCQQGVQLTGAITPSDYMGTVVLRRNKTGAQYQMGQTVMSGYPVSNEDDTSGANYRQDTPQAGSVYDLDAPGIRAAVGMGTYRSRFNFQEYAVLNSQANNVPVSPMFAWYADSSCLLNNSKSDWATDLVNVGDNQSGTGSRPITWNLQ